MVGSSYMFLKFKDVHLSSIGALFLFTYLFHLEFCHMCAFPSSFHLYRLLPHRY